MSARRKAAVAAIGLTPLALTGLAAAPAAAHGSMGDPVSRVFQCFAEGPESPKSEACKAAVAAGRHPGAVRLERCPHRRRGRAPPGADPGRQAVQRRQRGVQGPRPGARRLAGDERVQWRPHLQVPGDGPAQGHLHGVHHQARLRPLPAAGLGRPGPGQPGGDVHRPGRGRRLLHLLRHPPGALGPAAAVRGLAAVGQPGGLLLLLGRHLRRRPGGRGRGRWRAGRRRGPAGAGTPKEAPAPEAPAPAPEASAPSERQIEAGAEKSTVENHGHGDADPATTADPVAAEAGSGNQLKAAGGGQNLAETGGDENTSYLMIGGAAALALGSAALFASARRRTATGRHGR